MISKVHLICQRCGKEFDRNLAEYKRNQRKNRKTYCSLNCSGDVERIPKSKRNNPNSLIAGNRKDEFSPFRFHYRNAKQRNKEFSLTLEDIKEIWEKQNGICPYTGWKLINADNLSQKLDRTPNRASLDRIDSNKGYTKDNVHFIAVIANFAKNSFSDKELIGFCESVVQNYRGK